MPDLATTFAALGDPTRFAIVQRLMTNGALPVGDLLDLSDISPPAFSRHLKVLRSAGIVTQTIDKQRRIYAVDPSALHAVHGWIMDHRAFWDTSLDRLASALDADPIEDQAITPAIDPTIDTKE